MNEKLKFTVGGVEVFLSREDVEQRLRTVEPENIREVSVEITASGIPSSKLSQMRQGCCAAISLLTTRCVWGPDQRMFLLTQSVFSPPSRASMSLTRKRF